MVDYLSYTEPQESKPQTALSVCEAFGVGVKDSLTAPTLGLLQIAGYEPTQRAQKEGLEKTAETTGSMVGSAVLFYATSTLIKSATPLKGYLAPVAAGAALGFAEPVREDSSERLINSVRGASTMFIMEKAPGYLRKQGFRGDFVGNLGNVMLTGAAAGIVDANVDSLLNESKFKDSKTTAQSAASWALVGGAFHLASLGLKNKHFQVCTESQTPDLLVIGGKDNPAGYHVRDFLNSLSPFGVRYKHCDLPSFGRRDAAIGQTPLVVFPDGSRINGNDFGSISKKLGLHTSPDMPHYRVAVVGGGPAGVQTAINASSELMPGKEPVAVIAEVLGGQARYTSSIKNYMGFPDVTGAELMTRGIAGAKERGAEIVVNRVSNIELGANGSKVLTLRDGTKIGADAVVLATGMKYNQLEAPGIQRLQDRGVFTLADAHEAPNLKGKSVVLVGAGNSAGQAAVNFSNYARDVHMVVRGDKLGNSMSEYLVKEVERRPNITVHTETQVRGVSGESRLESVQIGTKLADGGERNNALTADAMYVYIGGQPNTGFLKDSIAKDAKGFLLTGDQLKGNPAWTQNRAPLPYETSMPGVFAAGDVNAANPQKRVVSAVGDAGKLIGSLHSYLPTVPLTSTFRPTTIEPVPGRLQFCIRLPTLGGASMLDSQRTWQPAF